MARWRRSDRWPLISYQGYLRQGADEFNQAPPKIFVFSSCLVSKPGALTLGLCVSLYALLEIDEGEERDESSNKTLVPNVVPSRYDSTKRDDNGRCLWYRLIRNRRHHVTDSKVVLLITDQRLNAHIAAHIPLFFLSSSPGSLF